MKIVIPGGSGHVGTLLAHAFHSDGHDVVVLSRKPARAPWRTVCWDGNTLGDWASEVDGSSVLINLTGRSVNCRYTEKNRAEIFQSRIASTRVLGEAISRSSRPPAVWLQASTATIYSHRYDAPNDEADGAIGGGSNAPAAWSFSIDVARGWEAAFREADTPGTRKIALRAAVIMSPDRGGIFDKLLSLVLRGLGGKAGDGKQFVSWIHHEDLVRAVRWLVDHEEVDGVVNIASPHPIPNEDFMRILRDSAGATFGLPASKWMLEIGALFMATETELILKSRRVIPRRLMEHGFEFKYPRWSDAARDLFAHWNMSTRNGSYAA